jgi:hypothetical protein
MALESPLFIWYLHHLCRLFSHMNASFWGSSHCHVWLLEGNSFRNIAGWQIEVLQDVVRIEIQPQSRSSPKQQSKLMEPLATSDWYAQCFSIIISLLNEKHIWRFGGTPCNQEASRNGSFAQIPHIAAPHHCWCPSFARIITVAARIGTTNDGFRQKNMREPRAGMCPTCITRLKTC